MEFHNIGIEKSFDDIYRCCILISKEHTYLAREGFLKKKHSYGFIFYKSVLYTPIFSIN